MGKKTFSRRLWGVSVVVVVLTSSLSASGRIVYVDDDAMGTNDGSSWQNAYNFLQDALSDANSSEKPVEIRVAQGVYTPDSNSAVPDGTGNRAATFRLINGVSVVGGYAGFGQPEPNARDIELYETILSGDLDGNDVDVNDPCDLESEPTRAENSYHVITGSGTDETATLDGFTITGGNAYATPWDPLVRNPNNCGAGVYNDLGSPVVINCTFSRNAAEEAGAGMFNYDSSPALMACAFAGNWAGDGGGIQNVSYSSPTLTNCIFSGNRASKDGGGINNGGAALTLTSCIFAGNSSVSGGGIRCPCAEVTATNCTFVGNRATSRYYYRGGGISGDDDTVMTLTNCIFWGNSDIDGMSQQAQIDHDSFPQTHINFCCVQSWTGDLGGTGNFGTDPCFADSNNGDYHLLPGSPCTDTGDNSVVTIPTDLDGNPRIINGIVDMGAYEYQGPHIFYVDADAVGANDGSSWADAYNYLQDGLMFATAGDEIRVAQGVYNPDDFVLSDRPSRGREETFQLINGVALKGGYAGFGQPDPNARDIELYRTVLSGDLDSNDVEVADPRDLANDPTRAENSFHVVTADGTEIVPSTVLDGFTITGGNANGAWEEGDGDGGGILCHQSSPTIMNCVIHGNSAGYLGHGGGMINQSGSPTLTNCTFRGNLADRYGGGMLNYLGSATLVECRFVGNTTRSAGGGVFNWSSEVSLTKCVLSGNSASKDSGGGMLSDDSSVTLRNCMFSGNWSRRNGGGLYIYDKTTRLSNCTFSGNSAGARGGGIYNYSGYAELGGCIVWGNLDSEIDGSATATYSDIRGGVPSEGNMDTDPCFAEPGYWDPNGTPEDANDDFWVEGDYHLKSQAGRWEANEGRWTIDEVTSLCIDAGDPMSPIGPEPFPNGGRINMGAYGGTIEASKSYFGGAVCETIVAGDVNGDCLIDFRDFYLLALHWMEDHNP